MKYLWTEQLRLRAAERLARKHGWEKIDHQKNILMVSYRRGGQRFNYYYSKGTVATSMPHPTKGKTQLFRKGVKEENALDELFNNPRAHTQEMGLKGYYRRDGKAPWHLNERQRRAVAKCV